MAQKILHGSPRHLLPSTFSIVSTELYAISLAVHYLFDNQIFRGIICSDILAAICFFWHQSPPLDKLSPNCRSYLCTGRETSLREITLIWIPDHKGLNENELVNITAKEAAINKLVVQKPLPISDLLAQIRRSLSANFARIWDKSIPINRIQCYKPPTGKWSPSVTSSYWNKIALDHSVWSTRSWPQPFSIWQPIHHMPRMQHPFLGDYRRVT